MEEGLSLEAHGLTFLHRGYDAAFKACRAKGFIDQANGGLGDPPFSSAVAATAPGGGA